MSSRIAVCGQHPVSTATMRSSGSTAAARSAFASSDVKMSFVTTTTDSSSREQPAQRTDERRLAAADGTTDADPQGPVDAVARWRSAALAMEQVVVQRVVRDVMRWHGNSRSVMWWWAVMRRTAGRRGAPWRSPRISVSEPPAAGSSEGGRSTTPPIRRAPRRPRWPGPGLHDRRVRSGRGRGVEPRPTSPPRRGGGRRARQHRPVSRPPQRPPRRGRSADGVHPASPTRRRGPALGQIRAAARISWRPRRRLVVAEVRRHASGRSTPRRARPAITSSVVGSAAHVWRGERGVDPPGRGEPSAQVALQRRPRRPRHRSATAASTPAE